MEFFTPELAPFTVALLVMLAIGVVELAALLMGFSPSGAIESALPEVDLDADAPDMAPGGPFSQVLGWLSVGRLPLLALLIIFLTSFALAGYAVQVVAAATLGARLGALVAAFPALVLALFATRHVGRWLGRILPQDETEAASQQDLVGSIATIIRGKATRGAPAEAKARDLAGRTHYFLVEPDEEGEALEAGQRVIIVRQEGGSYRAVSKLRQQQ